MVHILEVSSGHGCSPERSRVDRAHMIRHNMEYLESVWQRATEAAGEPHVAVLVDCCDPIGRMLAERLSDPARIAEMVRDCIAKDVIPTLYAAVPVAGVKAFLSVAHPSFVDTLCRCPSDCFAILVIAAGGSSIAFREVPS